MSVTGPGSITALNIQAVNNMSNQVDQLSTELGTNEKAQTYSGLSSQAGMALSLNAQLAALTGYSDTTSTVGTTLTLAQSVLSQLGDAGTSAEQALSESNVSAFTLNGSGQTSQQTSAASELDEVLSLLNTQNGNNYLFSGNALTQSSVASTSEILNGNGAQAGFTQILQERAQADGVGALGRLTAPTVSGTMVTIAQDSANSPFGFQLTGVNSSLTGATVTGPTGSPPSISVNMPANPNDGDSISFNLTLPDGSTQTLTLQATSSATPGTNQFSIGATPAATASNLQAALNTAVGNLADTALPAASAVAAANNFFNSNPPQIVNGPPYSTATSLVNGTLANTVFWYTGGSSATPARQTVTAQVGPGLSISYGMQADEPAISSLVANLAVLASTTYSASDPNAQASYQALTQRVTASLDGTSGTQSISDIEADLANAQTTVSNATTLNTQTQTTLTDMMQGIDGVNQTQIGEQLLTLQNSLSASLSVTARLAQLSLVNFLAPSSG
jgi:flagellar hook-associated protein 3 FlgL